MTELFDASQFAPRLTDVCIEELHATHTPLIPQSDTHPELIQTPSTKITVAEAIVKMLEQMGVKHAFGVSGGAI
ncbi:MAG: hypothetical protein AAF757_31925, partial [Cyanobacteria bacterium P01_D01_bin.116]